MCTPIRGNFQILTGRGWRVEMRHTLPGRRSLRLDVPDPASLYRLPVCGVAGRNLMSHQILIEHGNHHTRPQTSLERKAYVLCLATEIKKVGF
jgi:hypothetical protein